MAHGRFTEEKLRCCYFTARFDMFTTDAEVTALLFPPFLAYRPGQEAMIYLFMDDPSLGRPLDVAAARNELLDDEKSDMWRRLTSEHSERNRRDGTQVPLGEAERRRVMSVIDAYGALFPNGRSLSEALSFDASQYPPWHEDSYVGRKARGIASDVLFREAGIEREETLKRGRMTQEAEAAVAEERFFRPGGQGAAIAEAHFASMYNA
jgi:hypothetical protein